MIQKFLQIYQNNGKITKKMRLFCGNFAENVVKLPILKIFHRIM